jgi:tetratricopeptide (TPR) repeat protein
MRVATALILEALSLLLIPWSLAQEGVGRVVFVRGVLWITREDVAGKIEGHPGMPLHRGDRIETPEGSRAGILLWDESLIHLHGGSTLVVREVISSAVLSSGASRVSLRRAVRSVLRLVLGEVWVRSSSEMVWEVSNAIVGVRGTDLGIRLEDSGDALVWVLSGRVTIRHPLRSVELGEMEEAAMGLTRAPSKRAILMRPLETVQWVLRYPVWVSPRDIHIAPWLEADPCHMEAALLRDRGEIGKALELAVSLPEGPQKELLMGWLDLDMGRKDRALERLELAPRGYPARWIGLSICLIQGGRWGEAEASLAKAAAECGPRPEILALQGIVFLGLGRPDQATPLLRGAMEADPSLPSAKVHLALILMIWNRMEEAWDLAAQALSSHPVSPSVLLLQGWLLRAKGDLEGAMRAVQASLDRDPVLLPSLIQYAELLLGMERDEECLDLLRETGLLYPESAHLLALRGFLHLAKGEGRQAEAALREALDRDPGMGEAFTGLGILHMREGRTREALEAFLSATLLEPYASLPQSYLAKALHQVGRSQEALAALQRAEALDPMDPTPDLYRGLILRDLHRPGEAVRALERSMAKNDGRCVYRSRLLLDRDRAVRNVSLAEAYRDMGLLARAENRALLSSREDPANSGAHLFLASTFLEEGKTRAGVREMLRARLLMPVNANSFDTFHDYTMLLEAPRVRGEMEGGVGEHGTLLGDLLMHGGTGSLAGTMLVHGDRTEGFHEENHGERNLNWFLDLKARVAQGHELLLHGESLRWAQGDHQGDADAGWVQDPFLHQAGLMRDLGLGYRWHRGTGSELLFYSLWHTARSDLEDLLADRLGPGLRLTQDLDWELGADYLQAGLVQMGRSGGHRWEWGVHWVSGEETLKKDDRVKLRGTGGLAWHMAREEETDLPPAFLDLHAGDILKVTPRLFLEGSLHVQWSRMGTSPPVFSSETEQRIHFCPRFGVIWSPSPRDTLRLGLLQYVEPPYTVLEGLQPVEAVGFALGEDAAPGSWNRELLVAWDRDWGEALFTRLGGGMRIHRVWEERPTGSAFQARDLMEGRVRAEAEFLILPSLSLVARYGLKRFSWEGIDDPPGVWRGESWLEHRGVAEVRWVHHTGWRVLLRGTGVVQRGELGRYGRQEEAFWTDAVLERYLHGRRWLLRVAVQNVLDQPFRLKTPELVEEKGLPARQVVLSLRFQF